jgi:DNA-binding PadR family transcriptional regulator
MEDKLIEQVDGDASDPRRRYYRLTVLGRETAEAEARRLENQVLFARSRKLLTGPKR